ncbi:MAG: histidine phosphatase family protein [Verrucomicrobia bacterium]|nr:histidine phosphatase family protein [Verrucomicrobiota bacterium]MDA1068455.1 histidine phosphatase family protein [Verrucomicrobiota bacterium]
MKIIHLIRHAKSGWDNANLSDKERTISAKGDQSCKLMAERIVEAGCKFDRVFCSTATRAQMTIQALKNALNNHEIEWTSEEALYTFDHYDLLEWCMNLPDTLNELVVVGHNPAITEFTNRMSDRYFDNIPTCGYVQLVFPQAAWRDLLNASAKCTFILTPKQFL